MARVRYMKNSLDYVHFNNYLHTPKTFYFCTPLLTSSQPVITIYYCVSYQGLRNMGGGGGTVLRFEVKVAVLAFIVSLGLPYASLCLKNDLDWIFIKFLIHWYLL